MSNDVGLRARPASLSLKPLAGHLLPTTRLSGCTAGGAAGWAARRGVGRLAGTVLVYVRPLQPVRRGRRRRW